MTEYFPFEVQQFFSSWLGISPELLTWPYILIDVIIPFLFIWYTTYLMLKKIMPLRKISTWIYAVIALGPALVGMRLGRILIWPAVYLMAFLKIESWKWKIVAFIAITLLLLFIIPYLTF